MSNSTKYSAAMAMLSRRSVSHRGQRDAETQQLGEELREAYLSIMKEQATRFRHQPDWFRQQLGGREATNALSAALAQVPPDVSAEATFERLEFTMQGRSFSYSAETPIFIGRESHCDAVTTPITDRSVSRVSAILYPQPSRGLLLICDPGNLSGMRVVSRELIHYGLPESAPFSRNVLPLRWGERAEVSVCGVRVSFFLPKVLAVIEATRPSSELDERSTCCVCLDQPRSRCFLPCRHQVCCATCADVLLAQSRHPECPICRSEVVEAVPIEKHGPNRSFAAPAPFSTYVQTRKRKHSSP